jgi:membrane protein
MSAGRAGWARRIGGTVVVALAASLVVRARRAGRVGGGRPAGDGRVDGGRPAGDGRVGGSRPADADPSPGPGPATGRSHTTGQYATSPTRIPLGGWTEIIARVLDGIRSNQIPLLSAGVAFYATLALVPAMVAIVSVYGLLVSPAEAASQVASLTRALPLEAQQLVSKQLQTVARDSTDRLGFGLAVGVGGALWTASTGIRWMMTALSLVYDETETRRFLRLRAEALMLTAGALVSLVVSLGTLFGLPALFDAIGLAGAGRTAAEVVRFPILGAFAVVGLAMLYRYAPDRRQPQWRWVSYGSALAAALWLLGSVGLSIYASNVTRFSAAGTYGALGAAVVLMLWLYLGAFAILLGGEVNAEVEHQTSRDSTIGPEMPRGLRQAIMADEVAGWPSVAADSEGRRLALSDLDGPVTLVPLAADAGSPAQGLLHPHAGAVDRKQDPIDK